MTIKEALDDIVTSGINLGAGDFVDLEALEVAARVLEKMQWISVKDRLPEIKQDVLMCFDSGNMAVGFWYDGDEDTRFGVQTRMMAGIPIVIACRYIGCRCRMRRRRSNNDSRRSLAHMQISDQVRYVRPTVY